MLRDRLEGLALGGLALAAGQITQVTLVGVQVPLQAEGQHLVTGTQLLLAPAPLGGCEGWRRALKRSAPSHGRVGVAPGWELWKAAQPLTSLWCPSQLLGLWLCDLGHGA